MSESAQLKQNRLLVVTDLDGTLLSHDYDFSPASEALDALRQAGAALVLNSSKTVAEMQTLARKLNFNAPFVAENGGIIARPSEFPEGERGEDYAQEILGLERAFILEKAHYLRAQKGYRFEGFDDWSLATLIAHTGLDLEEAKDAKTRQASEPILWEDSEERFWDFKEDLATDGIRILRGGRFFHLMGQADKADGLMRVKNIYAESFPDSNWICVALGDSANDLQMLEAADIAVVIPRVSGQGLRPDAKRVIHAAKSGPAGWNAVVLELLASL